MFFNKVFTKNKNRFDIKDKILFLKMKPFPSLELKKTIQKLQQRLDNLNG